MGILANLVSYNGTSIEWDMTDLLNPFTESVIFGVSVLLVLWMMLLGIRWMFSLVRPNPDPSGLWEDDPQDGYYRPLTGEETATLFPVSSSLPEYATSEKAMNYYMGRDSGGSLKDETKTNMYVWDGNSRMGQLAGPKGYLP